MTNQEIDSKYKTLKPNTMIRISNKPLYIGLNDDQRCVRLWSDAGYNLFGNTEIAGDDLYFATTKDYTIIVLMNEEIEDEFCDFVSATKSLIEMSSDPTKSAQCLKNCFDVWQ
mgnify:CR=1 FL=1|tara:strand:+ start:4704 stop:5042 length:339 start_codon:yes stop_codon:yes gene_type:complete